jgi:hypothetical protein
MAGSARRSMGRKVLWGMVGYGVTTLGTLLTGYLTTLHISSLLGSILATTVGLLVVIIGVFIEAAKDGGGDDGIRQIPPNPAWPRHPEPAAYHGGYYRPAPDLRQEPHRRRRGAAGIAGVLALVIVLCGGGGFGLAYGVQYLGHKVIDALNEQATPPWEKKTQDPGRERIAKVASHTEGALTVIVSSVRVNGQATIVTITAKNTGKDSLSLAVYSNALLDVPGANTRAADPATGTFGGMVPAHGQATGTIVFDGVLGTSVTHVTLSFAHVLGSFSGPDNIAVDIPLSTAG